MLLTLSVVSTRTTLYIPRPFLTFHRDTPGRPLTCPLTAASPLGRMAAFCLLWFPFPCAYHALADAACGASGSDQHVAWVSCLRKGVFMLPSLLTRQAIAVVKLSPLNSSYSLRGRQHGAKSILFLLQTSCLMVWESEGGEKPGGGRSNRPYFYRHVVHPRESL